MIRLLFVLPSRRVGPRRRSAALPLDDQWSRPLAGRHHLDPVDVDVRGKPHHPGDRLRNILRGAQALGALVSFLVTVSGATVADIGAVFWPVTGLVVA